MLAARCPQVFGRPEYMGCSVGTRSAPFQVVMSRDAGRCRPLTHGAYGSAAHPATDQDDRALGFAYPGHDLFNVGRRHLWQGGGFGDRHGILTRQRRCSLGVQADFEEYRPLPGRAAVKHGLQDDVAGDWPLNSQCSLGDATDQLDAVDFLDAPLAHRAAA